MFKGKRALPDKFFELQKEYTAEKSVDGKLRILQEMLELIPVGYYQYNKVRSHVTHTMRNLRTKIKQRENREEALRKSRSFIKDDLFSIVLFGDANSGKTRLLNQLCNTEHLSTPAPFETKVPIIGVFEVEGVKLRLIELPSAFKQDHAKILRESDLIVVMPDSERFIELINELTIEVPVKVLNEYPINLWDVLDLLIINLRGESLIVYKGTKLSDLDIKSGVINGVKQKGNYLLKHGDKIE